MGKTRSTALVLAVVIMALAFMRVADANHQTSHKAFSGGATFKGLVVKTESEFVQVTSTSPASQIIDSRGFRIPAKESQLIVVDFSAVTTCLGDAGTCALHVFVGRTSSTAVQAEPVGFSVFDNSGVNDGAESHTLTKAVCVNNDTASPVDVTVWLRGRRSNAEINFQVADYAFKIARNAPCSPFVNI